MAVPSWVVLVVLAIGIPIEIGRWIRDRWPRRLRHQTASKWWTTRGVASACLATVLVVTSCGGTEDGHSTQATGPSPSSAPAPLSSPEFCARLDQGLADIRDRLESPSSGESADPLDVIASIGQGLAGLRAVSVLLIELAPLTPPAITDDWRTAAEGLASAVDDANDSADAAAILASLVNQASYASAYEHVDRWLNATCQVTIFGPPPSHPPTTKAPPTTAPPAPSSNGFLVYDDCAIVGHAEMQMSTLTFVRWDTGDVAATYDVTRPTPGCTSTDFDIGFNRVAQVSDVETPGAGTTRHVGWVTVREPYKFDDMTARTSNTNGAGSYSGPSMPTDTNPAFIGDALVWERDGMPVTNDAAAPVSPLPRATCDVGALCGPPRCGPDLCQSVATGLPVVRGNFRLEQPAVNLSTSSSGCWWISATEVFCGTDAELMTVDPTPQGDPAKQYLQASEGIRLLPPSGRTNGVVGLNIRTRQFLLRSVLNGEALCFIGAIGSGPTEPSACSPGQDAFVTSDMSGNTFLGWVAELPEL